MSRASMLRFLRWQLVFLMAAICMVPSLRAQGKQEEICSIKDPNNPLKRFSGDFLHYPDYYELILDKHERIRFYATDFEKCRTPAPSARPQASCPPPAPRPEPRICPQDGGGKAASRDAEETLTMLGSGTISRGALPVMIRAFAKARSYDVDTKEKGKTITYDLVPPQGTKAALRIIVTATGSADSGPALKSGEALVGLSSAPYDEDDGEQIKYFLSAGKLDSRGELEHVVALDGLVPVVHPENPIKSIELCDLAKIYAGNITNWRSLGWESAPIEVHALSEHSGTQDMFAKLMSKACGVKPREGQIHKDQVLLKGAIRKSRYAIGYVGKAELTDSDLAPLSIGGKCSLMAGPDAFDIKSEDYPLSRRLYMYTPYLNRLGYNARDFLDYLFLSKDAQDALGASQTTSLNIVSRKYDDRPQRSAHLKENSHKLFGKFRSATLGGERLSISFRFDKGSDVLDTRARMDVLRLIAYLKEHPPRGKILLAGFADSSGSAAFNEGLAAKRAAQVRNEIARNARELEHLIIADGYSSTLPVVCNDTPLGQEKNRRVEVWLLPQ